MTVKEYVMESVFKINLSPNLVLVKLQGFPINGSEKVRDGVCL